MNNLKECTACNYRTYKQFNLSRHLKSKRHLYNLIKTIEIKNEPKYEQINEPKCELDFLLNDEKSQSDDTQNEGSFIEKLSDSGALIEPEINEPVIIYKKPGFYLLPEIEEEIELELPKINFIKEEPKIELPKIELPKIEKPKTNNNISNYNLRNIGLTMMTAGVLLPMM